MKQRWKRKILAADACVPSQPHHILAVALAGYCGVPVSSSVNWERIVGSMGTEWVHTWRHLDSCLAHSICTINAGYIKTLQVLISFLFCEFLSIKDLGKIALTVSYNQLKTTIAACLFLIIISQPSGSPFWQSIVTGDLENANTPRGLNLIGSEWGLGPDILKKLPWWCKWIAQVEDSWANKISHSGLMPF